MNKKLLLAKVEFSEEKLFLEIFSKTQSENFFPQKI